MTGEREAKRARQACLNCRRKKTRCRGERPECSLCLRLGQECEYAAVQGGTTANHDHARFSPSRPTGGGLAARVAKLEAHLRAVENAGSGNNTAMADVYTHHDSAMDTNHRLPTPQSLVSVVGHVDMSRQEAATSTSTSTTTTATATADDIFSQLPPPPVFKALTDAFFANCHNQPYSFFHEGHMRSRIDAGEVPQYLLLAIAATASRYSVLEYFKGCQMDAGEAMSRASWAILLSQVFATDAEPEIAAVQAIAMLAVIDFTAGHHRLGWVKIGLAIRLVHELKLNAEPDVNMPVHVQEEYRRTFWSIYVLDKFVSCGNARPPTISDSDCTVALPCSEESFRMEASEGTMMTLGAAQELSVDSPELAQLNHFAILVIMVSTFGLVIREVFQDVVSQTPPWDFRSNTAKIGTKLLNFEGMHAEGANATQLPALLVKYFGVYEGFDRQRVGHFIWARGVYHLCGCLIYHPLNHYRQRLARRTGFPSTFSRESLDRCQNHAAQLTTTLQVLQTTGCCARGSFLGYMAVCAASVHRLFVHSHERDVAALSAALLAQSIAFLEHGPLCWRSYEVMARTLRDTDTDPNTARQLIDVSTPIVREIPKDELAVLWRLLDYGWMCKPTTARLMADGHHGGPVSTGLGPETPDWAFLSEQFDGSTSSILDLVRPDLIGTL